MSDGGYCDFTPPIETTLDDGEPSTPREKLRHDIDRAAHDLAELAIVLKGYWQRERAMFNLETRLHLSVALDILVGMKREDEKPSNLYHISAGRAAPQNSQASPELDGVA